MKRILFAYPEVSPPFVNGGIGTFVNEAAHLLAESGEWDVDILADSSYGGPAMRRSFPKAQRTFQAAGIRLLDLEETWRDSALRWIAPDRRRADRYLATISRLHADRPYDLIETPDWRAPGAAMIRAKCEGDAFPDTRLLVHLHSTTEDVHRWNAARPMNRADRAVGVLERYAKDHADALRSPSRSLLAAITPKPDRSPRPIIRCGYPVSSAPEVEPRRSEGERPLRVACISRLEPRKGQDLLAAAMRDLASSHDGRGVELIFRGVDNFGIPPDRRMSRTIHRILADTPGWSILPPQGRSELRRWLAEVDVCVVPSRGDNYPNVVLEGAAAGCRIVCSEAGGIPDLLEDYQIAAAVFPAGDAVSLREALRGTIADARDDRDGRQARRDAFERARRTQARRVLESYESSVNPPLAGAMANSIRTGDGPDGDPGVDVQPGVGAR